MKSERIIRISSFLMIFLMVLIAQMSEEKEIIFPEIAAIVTGMWLSREMPWKVGKIKMLVLMTLMAVVGVIAVAFLPFSTDFRAISVLVVAAVVMNFCHCTLLPMISACVLPVLMGTKSVVYPVSVFVMTLIIICARCYFEYKGYRQKPKEIIYNSDGNTEIKRWLMIISVFSVFTVVAVRTGYTFFVAPPLVVTFAELTYNESPARKIPFRVLSVIAGSAFVGAYLRILISLKLGLSNIFAVTAILPLIYLIFKLFKCAFPPAAALALLPFIIPDTKLFIYPFTVTLGAAAVIASALLIGTILVKTENINSAYKEQYSK